MRKQHDPISEPITGLVAQVLTVGEALAPRALTEATFEDQRLARLLGGIGAVRDSNGPYWELAIVEVFLRSGRTEGGRALAVVAGPSAFPLAGRTALCERRD
jgi:hypothetical protein